MARCKPKVIWEESAPVKSVVVVPEIVLVPAICRAPLARSETVWRDRRPDSDRRFPPDAGRHRPLGDAVPVSDRPGQYADKEPAGLRATRCHSDVVRFLPNGTEVLRSAYCRSVRRVHKRPNERRGPPSNRPVPGP